jgi:hypothetical protein
MDAYYSDTDLIAGLLEHLACHLQTGRPRSAHLARLLLDRLASETASETLRERCQQLWEVLEERSEQSQARTVPLRRQGPMPWLTWECLGEAA